MNWEADIEMFKEVYENPKISSWDLQVGTADVKEHASIIRKKVHQSDSYGRWPKKKPFALKT